MKIRLLATLLLISIFVEGQITYQNSHHVSVGDSIHISKTSSNLQGINFDTTGANISWNFSSIVPLTQADAKYIDAKDAGYKNTWCLNNNHVIGCNTKFADYVNIATQELEGFTVGSISFENVVKHYKQENDNYVYKMLGTTFMVGGLPVALPIEYDVPDTLFQFPLNYGAADSNQFSYGFDLNNLGVNLKSVVSGTRKNEVNGWGSITTPYKTYGSVLKLKSTVITRDSVYTAQNTTEKIDTVITYTWWDLNENIPVFTAKSSVVNGVTINSSVSYIDTLLCVTPKAVFVYAPVIPYYDTTTFSSSVTFSNLSASTQNVSWDFGDGATSTEKFPTHAYQCPGTYQVKLIATNNICMPSESDTITLPLVVVDSAEYFIKNSTAELCAGDSVLINGTYEKTAGTYSKTFTSSRGCDSTNTVAVSVTSLDTSLLSIANTLSAKELNAKYQWVDCNNNYAALVGDTSTSYSPSQTGNYAVQITKKGCTVTSECKMVMITSVLNTNANSSSAYPNPTSGILNIDLGSASGGQISVQDFSGRMLLSKRVKEQTNQIDLSQFKAGTYLVQVAVDGQNGIKTFRILIN